jgi:hypothetical protein
VFFSVVQSGPSQRFLQGECWPTFPTRSPEGVSRPRRVLRSGHSLPGGEQMASSYFPPIRKRGGADVRHGAQWALPLRDSGRPAHVKRTNDIIIILIYYLKILIIFIIYVISASTILFTNFSDIRLLVVQPGLDGTYNR